MRSVNALIWRNIKLFFKDKGMFFTSLITPAILLVLYVTFLADVYRDTFTSSLPQGIALPQNIADGLVGAQLMSSILAVSCVTVAFCSNFLMVQDKSNGSVRDLRMTPVSPAALAVGYYAATFISTFIIAAAGMALCLIYVWAVGWFMSLGRRAVSAAGRVCAYVVRYCAVFCRKFLSVYSGSGFRGGYNRQRGLRLYLRRVYAYIVV